MRIFAEPDEIDDALGRLAGEADTLGEVSTSVAGTRGAAAHPAVAADLDAFSAAWSDMLSGLSSDSATVAAQSSGALRSLTGVSRLLGSVVG